MTIPRREMVELAAFAAEHGCRGSIANKLVAEGRDHGTKYSSCGDLVHACLYACGCRADQINRVEHNGWRPGWNIAKLHKWWVRSLEGKLLTRFAFILPGDFVLYDGGTLKEHVAVVLSISDDRTRVATADYGQPGGKVLRDLPVNIISTGSVLIRGRPVTHHGSLRLVPWSETPQNVGDWASARGAEELAQLWHRDGLVADRLWSDEDRRRVEAER